MTNSTYLPTSEDKLNVCMAYLSYTGEQLDQESRTPEIIYQQIKETMINIPTLLGDDGKVDWEIVWGPAIYTYHSGFFRDTGQDSGMFVARQISDPSNHVVAIRGTNSMAILDWVMEDFEVGAMKDWPGSEGAKISKATEDGIELLRNKLVPAKGLPGECDDIETFLGSIAQGGAKVSFTGHSLGGALAPTLALHFKEKQGQIDGWDQECKVDISCTAFAGATAGNDVFATYSNSQFASNPIRRIHNTNDIVPHAWNKQTMKSMKSLYKDKDAKLGMGLILRGTLNLAICWTKHRHYTQIDNSIPITFPVDGTKGDNFMFQAAYQHISSYPVTILGESAGNELLGNLNHAEAGLYVA